jgi:hypothetical protein
MTDHTFAIPVYETSSYLEECIRHLKSQSIVSNIILTTSTPTNETQLIAERYQLPYYTNPEKNAGIAGDWNFALKSAPTTLVTLAHQDDIYASDYVEAVLKHFKQYAPSQPLIAFTNYQDTVNDEIRHWGLNALIKQLLLFPFIVVKCSRSRFLKRLILKFGNPVCCPSVTFNKAALGNFAFSKNFRCALDWLAWYQLAQRDGTFIYINKKLVQHRIHADSETARQLVNGRRRQEEQQLFEMMWGKRVARWLMHLYARGHRDNL